MLLSVGYPVLPQVDISDTIFRHIDRISEIYFAWRNAPSGRMGMSKEAQTHLESDLSAFHEKGLRLCLLINGNCYGAEAISLKFASGIKDTIEEIRAIGGSIDSVTTTSPFVACVVKNEYPDIETKASINLKIGTIAGMEYYSEYFDGFYVQREYNRDFTRLTELKKWADNHEKQLYGLLNSGCLSHCPNQTFHDNLVSHEAEITACDPLPGFNPVTCHTFYANPENWDHFTERGNWIRPEDMHYYDDYFAVGKLATRMHESAPKVIGAYARQSWPGNLADLLEPRFHRLFVDNRSFAQNWLFE